MEQARKECILRSAVQAFTRFGFKKASIDEIAKDAGVAKGTVYLACESKEDLFYQALHREVREWMGEASRMIDPRVPADELMMQMAFASLEQINNKPMVKSLLSGACGELLPRWQERFRELRSMCSANVAEILRLGIKQGRFRADIDVEAVAQLLMDLQIDSLLFHNADTPDRTERLERRAQAAFDLMLQGLLPRGPEKQPARHTQPRA
jgi:AcrR family transcriptional regulator